MSTIQQQKPLQKMDNSLYICERSIDSAYNVFTDLHGMSKMEAFMVKTIYEGHAKSNSPLGIIYLESTPQNCLERAHSRGYPSDIRMTLQTMEDIDKKYKKWLFETPIPVHYVRETDHKNQKPEVILQSALQFFKSFEKN